MSGIQIHLIKIAIVSVAIMALSDVARADEMHDKLTSIVTNAETIYAEAKAIVSTTPTTDDGADEIAKSVGAQFSDDERVLQDSVRKLASASSLPADLKEAVIRVGQFDNFIFETVTDVYFCKNATARWRLEISRQLLDHAHLALDGRPKADWDPDLDAAPDETVGCK